MGVGRISYHGGFVISLVWKFRSMLRCFRIIHSMNLNLHALPLIVALGLSLDKHTANVIRKLFFSFVQSTRRRKFSVSCSKWGLRKNSTQELLTDDLVRLQWSVKSDTIRNRTLKDSSKNWTSGSLYKWRLKHLQFEGHWKFQWYFTLKHPVLPVWADSLWGIDSLFHLPKES